MFRQVYGNNAAESQHREIQSVGQPEMSVNYHKVPKHKISYRKLSGNSPQRATSCKQNTEVLTLFAFSVPSHSMDDIANKATLTASMAIRQAPTVLITLEQHQ